MEMSKIIEMIAISSIIAVLEMAAVAASNVQSHSAATNVSATNSADGHVLVSWDDDSAPVHRVGWANYVDVREAQAAGEWLEAFHFADT